MLSSIYWKEKTIDFRLTSEVWNAAACYNTQMTIVIANRNIRAAISLEIQFVNTQEETEKESFKTA